MAEPGKPTTLTSELLSDIREGLLAGKTQEAIKEELGIPNSTWCTWFYDNYNGFRDSVELWRLARKVKVAEDFSDRLMYIAEDDKDILKLKQKESEFIRETIGNYSKKQGIDVTSKGESISVTSEQQKRIAQEILETSEQS